MIRTETFMVDNGHGWELGAVRIHDTNRLDRRFAPVVIVPGYGMNGFIFTFHPKGAAFADALASTGFEVWIANLRGQEPSRSIGGHRNFKLEDLALRDLPAVLNKVVETTLTARHDISLIGASLGGTISYLYLAMGTGPKVSALVSIGGPLRWESTHPLVRIAFGSPFLAVLMPTMGVRKLAGFVLPKLRAVPQLLSIYLHPELVDLDAASELVKTVENPTRSLNLQISSWIRRKDLLIGSSNLTETFRKVEIPILCVVAVGDGIVPRETATSALRYCGSKRREVLEIGDEHKPYAHADLFVGNDAERDVFLPVARWLQSIS